MGSNHCSGRGLGHYASAPKGVAWALGIGREIVCDKPVARRGRCLHKYCVQFARQFANLRRGAQEQIYLAMARACGRGDLTAA